MANGSPIATRYSANLAATRRDFVDLNKGAGPDSLFDPVRDPRGSRTRSIAYKPRSWSSAGEENHGYPVIVQVNDRWRVVTCRAGNQWVLQRDEATIGPAIGSAEPAKR